MVWTANLKASCLTSNESTDWSRNSNNNIIVDNITKRGENLISIVNTYKHKPRETEVKPVRRLKRHKIITQWGGGTVLVGYSNAHTQHLDPMCTELREDTDSNEIIRKDGPVLGNEEWPTQCLRRNECEGESLIDLNLAN